MSLIDITTEIGKSIIALVDAKTGGAPDKETIVSSDGKVSAVGVKESNNNKAIKTWVGTLEEYEALETIDENTLYTITDDIEGDEVFNTTKVNLDGSNYVGSALSNVVEETHWNTKITNCITEIPQRIKLELNEGTLTLKAGSVVIFPYGIEDRTAEFPVGAQFVNSNWKVAATQFTDSKFFVWAELQEDVSKYRTETPDGNDRFIDVYLTGGLNGGLFNQAQTGTSFSTGLGYNPTENTLYWYNSSGVAEGGAIAFPLGIVACDDNYTFGSIKQVFNGIGYIGSTVWVDKGVKGLIPNGKNEDGSLKNIEYTQTKLSIFIHEDAGFTSNNSFTSRPSYLLNSSGTLEYWLTDKMYYTDGKVPNISITGGAQRYYDSERNKWTVSGDGGVTWSEWYGFFIASGERSKELGVIKLKPNNARVLSYGSGFDTREMALASMPSSKYIDLTLGASQSTYMAPANGWIALECVVQTGGLFLCNTTMGIGMGNGSLDAGSGQLLHIPVSKGDVFMVDYTGINSVNLFKFVYAQGEI